MSQGHLSHEELEGPMKYLLLSLWKLFPLRAEPQSFFYPPPPLPPAHTFTLSFLVTPLRDLGEQENKPVLGGRGAGCVRASRLL